MKLLACGSNAKGQLAVGDDSDRSIFTPCSFASSRSGELPPATSIMQVAFGANHTLALCDNAAGTRPERSVWGVGDGSRGQLGLRGAGAPAFTVAFQKLDIRCSGVSLRDRNIKHIAACWETSFVVYRSLDDHAMSSASDSDVCVSMGSNDFGDLGAAPVPASSKRSPVLPPSSSMPVIVSFAFAIRESGLQPASEPLPVIRITQITTGLHHVLAVLSLMFSEGIKSEILVGWGASRNGQLDLHDFDHHHTAHTSSSSLSSSSSAPTPRARKTNGGVTFTQSPKHLYTVPPTGSERIVSIALGQHHSVVLLQHDQGITRFLCGGSNRKGQLDFRPHVSVGVGGTFMIPRSVACTWNGTFVVYEPSSPPSAGDEDRERFGINATGSGERGQLGRELSANANASASASAVGGGLQPVVFPGSISRYALSSFASGSEHALAVLNVPSSLESKPARSEVWGWGWNEHGNLGLGHSEDVPLPTRLWPPPSDNGRGGEGSAPDSSQGQTIRGVWAGNGTSWLLVD